MARSVFFCAITAAAVLLAAAPATANTKAGVDAWTRGDFAAAVKVWQVEAVKGDADALFNLAQAYKLGKGTAQDLARAEDLFGRAAALGHPQAGDNYGLLLFQRGQRTQALPFIRAAADRGDPRAQYLLGIGHFNGDIVPKDWVRAYALVSLAQQAGLTQATEALTQMDKHVPMAQRQEAVALSAELRSEADATRARQLAAAELGAVAPGGEGQPVRAPMRTASVSPPNGTGPANAGADYARPITTQPRPSAGLPPAPAPVRVVQPRPQPVVAATAPAPETAPPASSGAWRVQLGAFGVAANADALWQKLKGRPELAGHSRLNVKVGNVIKLQAGGFASEAAARAACARLAASGQTCLPTRN